MPGSPTVEATAPTTALLRRSTREEHVQAEAHLAPLTCFDGVERLQQLLQLLEGFHAGMEDGLADHVEAPGVPAELRRDWRRAAALRRDLRRLGCAPGDDRAQLPPPAGRDEALGAWYVLEGSRLGGRVLARDARRRLTGVEHALGALSCEGAPGRWPAFRRWLDGPAGVVDPDAAVAGARDAFRALDAWAARS